MPGILPNPRSRQFHLEVVPELCHPAGILIAYCDGIMDPLLAADRLPSLAVAAMRGAIVGALALGRRPTVGSLVNDALVRFERNVQLKAPDGVRPALLFAQRDRILRGVREFLDGRFSARLFKLRERDVIALGDAARPFDAIVRAKDGRLHAVVFRALPRDGRSLESLRRIRSAAVRGFSARQISSVLVWDLDAACSRRLNVQGGAAPRAA
jgi:hypothetical protein